MLKKSLPIVLGTIVTFAGSAAYAEEVKLECKAKKDAEYEVTVDFTGGTTPVSFGPATCTKKKIKSTEEVYDNTILDVTATGVVGTTAEGTACSSNQTLANADPQDFDLKEKCKFEKDVEVQVKAKTK